MRRCSARRGKQAEKPEAYPLRYTEDFFAMFDEVAAGISSSAAEDIFEMGSRLVASSLAQAWLQHSEINELRRGRVLSATRG
jgi:hypothetical protein